VGTQGPPDGKKHITKNGIRKIQKQKKSEAKAGWSLDTHRALEAQTENFKGQAKNSHKSVLVKLGELR